MTNRFSRGQATVELLMILVVLFGILAVSIQLFANQRAGANQQEIQNAAARNGQLVAQAVMDSLSSPIGSVFRVYIPPGPASQTIRIRGGFVEVQSGSQLALISIPDNNATAGPFSDARTIQISHTLTGIQVGT